MLTVVDLCKSYGAQVLLENVSFTMGRGERLGLVGRNGHGKSTLLRILSGDESPDSGRVSIPSDYRLGKLSQHIDFTKETVLEEACRGLSADRADQIWRAQAILTGLGFEPSQQGRPLEEFSGGYHLRIKLARVLLSEPDLLLLDEPTNYLDIVSIRWLQRILRGWRGELILVTHDRQFMDSVTTHTLGIYRKNLRKVVGPTTKLYDQLYSEEEIHEKTRKNDIKKRRAIQEFIDRFGAKARKASQAQSRVKLLEKMPVLEALAEEDTLDFKFTAAPMAGLSPIDLKGLSFAYPPPPGKPPVALFEGIDLCVDRRDRIAIIGTNGRGKSTLLRVIASELTPTAGSVMRHSEVRQGFFGQTNVDRLSPSNTVEQEVTAANTELSRTRVRNICGLMLFDGDRAEKKIEVLSGGERARCLLARILATPCNVLLLDEPTSHLDMESVEALVAALQQFPGVVILVTHSEMVLRALATRLVVFRAGGAQVFEGTYDEFLEKGGWADDTATDGSAATESTSGGPSRKELRQRRSEVIRERSKELGPQKREIEALEACIMRLEAKVEADQHALVEASQAGQSARIVELSRAVAKDRAQVEALFAQLEDLSTRYDAQAVKYDKMLQDLAES